MCGKVLEFTSLDFMGRMAFSSHRFHKSFIHLRNVTGFSSATGTTVLGVLYLFPVLHIIHTLPLFPMLSPITSLYIWSAT